MLVLLNVSISKSGSYPSKPQHEVTKIFLCTLQVLAIFWLCDHYHDREAYNQGLFQQSYPMTLQFISFLNFLFFVFILHSKKHNKVSWSYSTAGNETITRSRRSCVLAFTSFFYVLCSTYSLGHWDCYLFPQGIRDAAFKIYRHFPDP